MYKEIVFITVSMRDLWKGFELPVSFPIFTWRLNDTFSAGLKSSWESLGSQSVDPDQQQHVTWELATNARSWDPPQTSSGAGAGQFVG